MKPKSARTLAARIISGGLAAALLCDPAFAQLRQSPARAPGEALFDSQAFAEQPAASLKKSILSSAASARLKRALGRWSRRDLVRFTGAAALLAAPVMAQSSAGADPSRFLSTFLMPVRFEKLDHAAWNAQRDNQLLQAVGTAAGLSINSKGFLGAWQNNAITTADVDTFQKFKAEAVSRFMGISGFPARAQAILGRGFPQDLDAQWDALLFEILPRYFGERGFYFSVDYDRLQKDQANSLAHMEMALSFSLHPILDKREVEVVTWSGKVNKRTEIEVEEAINLDERKAETGVFKTRALTDQNTIIRFPKEEKSTAHQVRQETSARDSVVKMTEGKEWEEVRGRWDPLNFSESKLIEYATKNPRPVADFERWQINVSRTHEDKHLADAAAGLEPVRVPWPKTWADYQSKIRRPIIASELHAMMAEARFIDRDSLKEAIISVTNPWKTTQDASHYKIARFNLVYLLLDHIASDAQRYGPKIRIDPSLTISARAQAAGQLYRLTYEQWTAAWDLIHERWEAQGRPLVEPPVLDENALYGAAKLPGGSSRASYEFHWPEFAAAGLIAGAGIFAGLRLRREYRERTEARLEGSAAVLAAEFRRSPLDREIRLLAMQLSSNERFKKAVQQLRFDTKGLKNLRKRAYEGGQNAMNGTDDYKPIRRWVKGLLWGVFLIFVAAILIGLADLSALVHLGAGALAVPNHPVERIAHLHRVMWKMMPVSGLSSGSALSFGPHIVPGLFLVSLPGSIVWIWGDFALFVALIYSVRRTWPLIREWQAANERRLFLLLGFVSLRIPQGARR